MTTTDLLAAVRARGGDLRAEGDRLRGTAPPDLRAAIAERKPELLALLHAEAALASLSEAEREEYEERAAIREYDGGTPREEAERLALEEVTRRLQDRDATKTERAGSPRIDDRGADGVRTPPSERRGA